MNEVETAIDGVRGSLPDGILEPQVNKVNVVGEPIGYVAVEADDMTVEQLSWFIDDTVAKRLLKIEGMAEVSRFGGVDRGTFIAGLDGDFHALTVGGEDDVAGARCRQVARPRALTPARSRAPP